MKIVGIIAEFNPMHNGHQYLIKKAKELTGADYAICLMSGNFTQAGNIALTNKFNRASTAIKNGFDAVIELPTIYATASAEFFAYGAVNILNSLNCIDYLCFGSETGNVDILINIAHKLIKNEENIWESITISLKEGISFAKAREYAISKFLTQFEVEISSSSNNILAIEYIKSLIKLNSNITPIAIKREENTEYLSATKLREKLRNNEDVSKYILDKNIGTNLEFNDNMYKIIKYKLVSSSKEYLQEINGITEGIENKLIQEINNSDTFDNFIQNVKSKRYQLSKIKRILISILLDITKADFQTLNANKNQYAHIITILPESKNELLSVLNSNSSIPIITSINDKKIGTLGSTIASSLKLDIRATNIYSAISNQDINKDYTNKL